MKFKIIIPFVLVLLSLIYYMFIRSDVADATLILVNGVVYTVNEKQPGAEAIAVSGGKIAAVGSNAEVQQKFRSSQVIDLKG
ncbi:MAG: putative TIM-barrel fold metal-dependent hydrolase, partial [Bacteroidetes bacterium]|nr:putative TIM-barrel fold metal-dependent hydrolase [Bacteroidota bacterium]